MLLVRSVDGAIVGKTAGMDGDGAVGDFPTAGGIEIDGFAVSMSVAVDLAEALVVESTMTFGVSRNL
jgi:hypothetical protein